VKSPAQADQRWPGDRAPCDPVPGARPGAPRGMRRPPRPAPPSPGSGDGRLLVPNRPAAVVRHRPPAGPTVAPRLRPGERAAPGRAAPPVRVLHPHPERVELPGWRAV